MDEAFARSVDFYYAVRHEGDALYVDEIDAAVARHPSLRIHIVYSERDGQLSADDVLPKAPPECSRWIYMCGPPPMMRALDKGFRRLGSRRAGSAGSSSRPADGNPLDPGM